MKRSRQRPLEVILTVIGEIAIPALCAGIAISPEESCRSQATTPKRAPTPVVNAIANAPQNVTRATDAITGEPPVRAARRPNNARKRSELPARPHISSEAGSKGTIRSGSAAPTANVPAEANAACTGFATCVSDMPSSSRACAPIASCCINWVATLDARASSLSLIHISEPTRPY